MGLLLCSCSALVTNVHFWHTDAVPEHGGDHTAFQALWFCQRCSLVWLSRSAGVAKYGVPVGLDASLKVDLIVVGSSAVSKNGCRLGKGEVSCIQKHACILPVMP